MFAFIKALYEGLFPDENSQPAHVYKWRKFVGNTLFVLCLMVLVGSFALTTGFPRIGSVVWAADLKTEVQQAVKPLDERLGKVETTVSAQASSTKALLGKLAGDQIMYLVRRRCKSKDLDEREYLTKEIGRYSEEYEDNKGKPYRIPSCDEIEYREPR